MKKALKKAFIPHEENDFRPHILRAKVVIPVLMTIILVQIVITWGITAVVPYSQLFGIIETNSLVDGTNSARIANNVPALNVDPLLQAAAQEKANDMATKGYFAHTSPQGLTPWYWFAQVGYNFSYAGENLAVNFSDSSDVTTAWLNSPEHRANILDPHFTQIGMAMAQGTYNGQSATYVVELFGAPAAVPTAVASAVEPQHPLVITKTKPDSIINGVKQPAVVAVNPSTSTEPISVAVKGAEISVAGEDGPLTKTATNNALPDSAAVRGPSSAPQTNFLQRAFANPNRSLNDLYYLVLLFFIVALSLNVFIKIRVQHPDLILGGLVAISVVGIFILVNQQSVLTVIVK